MSLCIFCVNHRGPNGPSRGHKCTLGLKRKVSPVLVPCPGYNEVDKERYKEIEEDRNRYRYCKILHQWIYEPSPGIQILTDS